MVLLERPLQILATVGIIILGKSAVAYLIVRAFGHPNATALTVSASLAQIGEFSFILAGLGIALGMLPPEGRDLVLAGAILSILLNPLAFHLAERRQPAPAPAPAPAMPQPRPAPPRIEGPEVIIGYGRVGSIIGARLAAAGRRLVVVEDRDEAREAAEAAGARVIAGNAADPAVLALAEIGGARRLFVTVPEVFEAGQVVEQARAANPGLEILARAHSVAAEEHLAALGATRTILGEREIAERMIEHALAAPARPARAAVAAAH
jgi:CPA2 family monovalent cation:H+ antiporter-2